MAITAEFLADFSSFEQGTKQATAALDNFEGKTATVSKDINNAFAGIDIQKLLSDPVGGATAALEGLVGLGGETAEFSKQLTQTFSGIDIQKLFSDPVGTATTALESLTDSLPPFAKGAIAFGSAAAAVGAGAFKLASWSAEAASSLGDLSDKTGITVPSLSRLSNAATVAGTDIGALSNVVYEVQKQMGEHPTQFADGLRAIGIEFQAFKEMKPEEQLLAIASGLQEQVDPVERLKTGTALLGKQYKDMAPALYDLADAMALTAGLDPITQEDADNAEEFEMKMSALKVTLKSIAQDIGLELVPAITALIDLLSADQDWPAWLQFKSVIEATRKEFSLLGDAVAFVTGSFTTMGPPIEGTDKVMASLKASTSSLALKMPDLDAAFAANATMAKEQAAALEKAERAAKALAEAQERLNAEAFKAQGEALGQVLDQIFGTEALKKATLWMDTMNTGINGVAIQVQDLRTNELEELNTTMLAGIDALTRSGQLTSEQSTEFARLAIEAQAALAALKPLVTVTEDLVKAQWDYVKALDEEARAQAKAAEEAKKKTDAAKAAKEDRPVGGGLFPTGIVGRGGVAYDQYGRPVVPGGAISGLPVVHVNINSPLGTPDAISRAVQEAMMNSYRGGGNRLPV